jgi:hypothetical protein
MAITVRSSVEYTNARGLMLRNAEVIRRITSDDLESSKLAAKRNT